MTRFTLRLNDQLDAAITVAAAEQNLSKHAYIVNLLEQAVASPSDLNPDIVIGYIELIGGEIDPQGTDCPECGQPLERPHIGFAVGRRQPQPFGPVCWICATTD